MRRKMEERRRKGMAYVIGSCWWALYIYYILSEGLFN